MKLKIILCAFFPLIFILVTLVKAQQIIPLYSAKDLQNNTLKIYSDSGILAITAYKANVIKVVLNGGSTTDIDSLNFTERPVNIRVTQNIDDVFFATDSLWVIVNKFDLSIKFLKKHPEELLLKCDSYFLGPQNAVSFLLIADDQPSLFNGVKKRRDPSKRFSGRKKLKKPILVSSKGYALLIENGIREKTKAIETPIKFEFGGTKPKTFYFLSGNTYEIKKNLVWVKSVSALNKVKL